jgi:hypothetical protein
MLPKARRGGKKRYEYFKQLAVARLVIGISDNIGRLNRKGKEAPNTLKGNERERNCMNRQE